MTELPPLEAEYELGEELGRGGFGVVRAARRRRDGAPAAVKLPHRAPDAEEAARIQREARLLESLRSPRLARLQGLFRACGGQLALVYDLVPGEDLHARAAERPPTPEEVLGWIEDLGQGLAALHAAGLVHRDVKPENVHVDASGHAVLLDFGLLRPASGETVTATGMILGTPEFLAPEQLRDVRAGPAADVYALGGLLYHLLEGRPPFRGDIQKVLALKLHSEPPAPRTAAGKAAWPLLRRLLDPDPAARPAAVDVPALLRRAFAEAPPSRTREPSATVLPARLARPHRTPRPGRPSRELRRRAPRRLVAGLFLALALGAFLTAPRGEPPAPSPSPPAPPSADPFESLLRDLHAELDWAQGAYVDADGELVPQDGDLAAEGVAPLLEPDPARFGFVARHMPVLGSCFAWLRDEDLLAHQLAPEVRARMAAYEDRFSSAGMPRPLYPAMELTPATTGFALPEALRDFIRHRVSHHEVEEIPAVLHGWSGRAAEEIWKLQAAYEELEEEAMGFLRANAAPPGVPAVSKTYLGLRAPRNLERFVREVGDDPRVRRQLLGWHPELLRSYQRVLLATGRATEAGEPAAAGLAIFVRERIRDWTVFQVICMRPGPPELLVGGRVTQPATRVLLASVLENLHNIQRDWGVPRDPRQRTRRRLLEASESTPPPGEGPVFPILAIQVTELATLYEQLDETALLLQTYRAWDGARHRLSPALHRNLVLRVGEAPEGLGGLEPTERAQMKAEACALDEGFRVTDPYLDDRLASLCRDL